MQFDRTNIENLIGDPDAQIIHDAPGHAHVIYSDGSSAYLHQRDGEWRFLESGLTTSLGYNDAAGYPE